MSPDKVDELLNDFESVQRYRSYTAYAQDYDEGETIWAMDRHVETPQEIEIKFNYVSYQKAAAIFKMFHEAIGEAIFVKGIRYFLHEMQFSPAGPQDLFRSLQKASDEEFDEKTIDIDELFNTWSTQPGYPMLNISKVSKGKLKITQQRYPSGGEVYSIPINFATSSNPNFEDTSALYWMKNDSIVIDYKDDWIIFNIQQTGFYCINYDQSLWNDIINQLNRNHTQIHYINRRSLFQHLLFAASKYFVDLTTSFRLMSYLKHETNELVWVDVESLVRNIPDRYVNYWFYDDLIVLLRNIFEINYKNNGYVVGSRKTNRACILGVLECSIDALERLLVLVDVYDYEVHPDIYCNGLRVANETIFWHFFNIMEKSEDLKFRSTLIQSLACSNDEKILKNYLNAAFGLEDLSNNTRRSSSINLEQIEKSQILEKVISTNLIGAKIAFDFLKVNHQKVYEM